MEDKIVNLLDNTVPRLVFALLSGLAYFTIIYRFIVAHTERGGGLLAFFFCPAIVCGAALIIDVYKRQVHIRRCISLTAHPEH